MKPQKPKKSVVEALGLPPLPDEMFENINESTELYSDDEEINDVEEDVTLQAAQAALSKLKDMRVQLKDIPDITKRKAHLDRLADLAERKFEDIFDRAFNVEDRFASEMLNSANAMLKMAIDAHSKVIDSDIKLVDLQLKKDKMEHDINSKGKDQTPGNSNTGVIEGEKVVSKTRNDMLASINANK
ncbi:hypothetical protein ACQ27_gp052 [Klebsiella phage K64-1]|uniref:Uncharacterized protein n=1 Tax=Klebsiella phage vB_KleM_RaK2 TaxID=1147094 RepID=H6X3K3_9CAUD|nr:hypothetical protein F403_gp489 [Klebsiella phage vB_KleM_RaK2]YP_010842936.1 hypothetical protein ACQ27_gp052 [Klebsiella phage K64-1]AFA44319.1 hypothetical protein RaK2_00046 [Klebsiella phage vB_KleM_RaK2]